MPGSPADLPHHPGRTQSREGIIEKTVDRLLYDSDDVESSIVKEIPEFLTLGIAI